MSHLPLDARAILEYLNELGYRNISADQLKEFIKDLRKLIKYEEHICWDTQRGDYVESLFKRTTRSYRAKIDQKHAHGKSVIEQSLQRNNFVVNRYGKSNAKRPLQTNMEKLTGNGGPKRTTFSQGSQTGQNLLGFHSDESGSGNDFNNRSKSIASQAGGIWIEDSSEDQIDSKKQHRSQTGQNVQGLQSNKSRSENESYEKSKSRQAGGIGIEDSSVDQIDNKKQQNSSRNYFAKPAASSSQFNHSEVEMKATRLSAPLGPEATSAANDVLTDLTAQIPETKKPKRNIFDAVQDEAATRRLVNNLFTGTGLMENSNDRKKRDNPSNGLLTYGEIQQRFREKIKEEELMATRYKTREEAKWQMLATRGKGTMVPRYQPNGRMYRPNFHDPVALYHWYQKEWQTFRNRIPGEATHSDVRWNIRQKLLDPHPIVRSTKRMMAQRPKNDPQPYLVFMDCPKV